MATDHPAPSPPQDTSDIRQVLDRELDRLPDKYRLPIVLCELEGLTLDEAARRLGWPKGTVAGRLSRGRELLRRRLSRQRGLLASMSIAQGLAGPGITPCDLPDELVSATVSAAGHPGSPLAQTAARIARAIAREAALRTCLRFSLIVIVAILLVLTGFQSSHLWSDAPPSIQQTPAGCH